MTSPVREAGESGLGIEYLFRDRAKAACMEATMQEE
jgi:hypothetical protein